MSWSAATVVAAHTAVLNVIDDIGAGGAATVRIMNSANVELSRLPLQYPAGTVNGSTGQLTLLFGARDEEAAATGTIDHVDLYSQNNVLVYGAIPVQEGTSPVAGFFVFPSLSVVTGQPVEGTTFTIG